MVNLIACFGTDLTQSNCTLNKEPVLPALYCLWHTSANVGLVPMIAEH